MKFPYIVVKRARPAARATSGQPSFCEKANFLERPSGFRPFLTNLHSSPSSESSSSKSSSKSSSLSPSSADIRGSAFWLSF